MREAARRTRAQRDADLIERDVARKVIEIGCGLGTPWRWIFQRALEFSPRHTEAPALRRSPGSLTEVDAAEIRRTRV